jgi:hypothetical protein
MRRWILAIVLAGSGVAIAAPGPTTQPTAQPATRPFAVAPEPPSTWTPYSTGGQQRRGSENGRSRRGERGDRGASGFSAAPSSRPDGDIADPSALPQDFDILNYRNIFYKGYLPSPDRPERSGPATPERHSAETTLIFNGVTITDGKPTAFLENTEQGTVVQVHVGDPIASGKVVDIALDSLDYQFNGRVIHVQIGQNLAGGSGWGTTAATTAPSSTGSADADSLLEKLRLRRQQELNGK